MIRGPLSNKSYRPQFSGHETFPMRYGWLKKAFDAINAKEGEGDRMLFLGDDAIARFGLGKNMVASMRHWAISVGIINETQNKKIVQTTALGRKLFDINGLDPYMEHPATLWLIHWQLSSCPEKTTWFWAFNHYSASTFDRDHLIDGLIRLVKDQGWSRVSPSTIKNDVACFVRTYVAQRASVRAGNDDVLESPLTELGLIKATGKRDGYRFVRGQKSTLGNGVFAYAVINFWSKYTNASTLSFEAIAHEPGGPGRVFLLDENDIVDRLAALSDLTNGAIYWSETAGLKQLVRKTHVTEEAIIAYIAKDYVERAMRKGAA